MRILLSSLLLVIISINSLSQNVFDSNLNLASADIEEKLIQIGKKRIVVLYITDMNRDQTTIGKYIANILSVYFVNSHNSFNVFSRENLAGITEANKLIDEGFIDATQVKELGAILSVEAIIIGDYSLVNNTLKLTINALDVNSGFIVAASINDIEIDDDAAFLLGINKGNNDLANRGFNNQPLNSGEDYNNPETVKDDCKEKRTGDYCFANYSTKVLKVSIFRSGGGYINALTLDPKQTQCFYDLQASTLDYEIVVPAVAGQTYYFGKSGAFKSIFSTGQIKVEQCKSKTLEIK